MNERLRKNFFEVRKRKELPVLNVSENINILLQPASMIFYYKHKLEQDVVTDYLESADLYEDSERMLASQINKSIFGRASNELIIPFFGAIPPVGEKEESGILLADSAFCNAKNKIFKRRGVIGASPFENAYMPEIIDSLIIGDYAFSSSGRFNNYSEQVTDDLVKAVQSYKEDDPGMFCDAVKHFGTVLNEVRKENFLKKFLQEPPDTQKAFIKFGELSPAAYGLSLAFLDTSETTGIRIDNSIIIGEELFNDALGGKITNSLIVGEELFTNAHLLIENSFIINPVVKSAEYKGYEYTSEQEHLATFALPDPKTGISLEFISRSASLGLG